MAEYDLVIRNTTIATASDVVKGDIGVLGGRVVALGERLDKGRKEIDASGLIAVPGGIDAHVHFDQDTADGSVFCDDFESAQDLIDAIRAIAREEEARQVARVTLAGGLDASIHGELGLVYDAAALAVLRESVVRSIEDRSASSRIDR